MEGPRLWVLRKGPGTRVLGSGSQVPGMGPGSHFAGMPSVKSSWFKFFDTEVSMLMITAFVFILESGYLILFLKH